MTSGPRMKWGGVKMMWSGWRPKRRRPTAGMGVLTPISQWARSLNCANFHLRVESVLVGVRGEQFDFYWAMAMQLLAICPPYQRRAELVRPRLDQIAMCYISMDSSRRALQTNGKFFFSNFGVIFPINYTFLNNSGVRFMQTWRGRPLCWKHAF